MRSSVGWLAGLYDSSLRKSSAFVQLGTCGVRIKRKKYERNLCMFFSSFFSYCMFLFNEFACIQTRICSTHCSCYIFHSCIRLRYVFIVKITYILAKVNLKREADVEFYFIPPFVLFPLLLSVFSFSLFKSFI